MNERMGNIDGGEPVMTARDVAEYLRFSEAKVYRMAKAGQIPAVRIGRAWRFKRELIDEWIRRESERARTLEVPVTS